MDNTSFRVSTQWNTDIAIDAFVVLVTQDEKAIEKQLQFLADSDKESVVTSLKADGFKGKKNTLFAHPLLQTESARKLLLVGVGEKAKLTDEILRSAAAQATRAAQSFRIQSVAILAVEYLPERRKVIDSIPDIVEGVLLSQYQFKKYKSPDPDQKKDLEEVVLVHKDAKATPAIKKAVEKGRHYSEGAMLARNLVNEPGDSVTPTTLKETAEEIAKQSPLIRCKVFDKPELKKRGFGAILAVARGSEQPPYLLHLTYKPKQPTKKKVFLVGKGITFDSGGISLKPSEGMETMKMDMAGAAAVLGVFSQISALSPRVEVHGLVATCENLPSGSAIKPGDVVTAFNKKTIEVLNTDAEGRMVLADALSYAETFKPDFIVDLATLTGACIVALGNDVAAILGTDQSLVSAVEKASKDAGEKIWQLPLEESYEEEMKGDIADVKNISTPGTGAGTITGALFLKNFVKETAWAHLDIAGPAWSSKEKGYISKGGTGFGVRTLLRFLQDV